ncbi:MAG: hypothetical protein AAEJ52_13430, partial [Myxococcota bacterium]
NEVGDGRDFPALLQRVFEVSGLRHVQVINFGLHWTGFHQAYMVWEHVGHSYDLDYVLLGPLGFLHRRDLTFHHAGSSDPDYLHSRFILDKGGVERIDVIGDTFEERFETYYGFVPSPRYMRYDREPPAFLAALLPKGRSIRNPFYYSDKSELDEARSTWVILLKRMAESGIPIIVGNYQFSAVEAAASVNRPNVVGAVLRTRAQFPYKAPEGHNSPMGNLRTARQYFALLTDDPRPIPLLEFEDLDELHVPAEAASLLDAFDGLEFSIGNGPLGYIGESDDTFPDYLFRHQIKTLLAVRQVGQSWLTASFIGLPIALTDEMVRDTELPMRRLHPNLAIWSIDVDRAVPGRIRPRTLSVSKESIVMLEALELGGQKWFEAGPAGDGGLSQLVTRAPGGWLTISADPRTLLDENALADRGNVDLVLRRAGETIRFPVARWHRETELPPNPWNPAG